MLSLKQNNQVQKESPTDTTWDFVIKGETYEEEKKNKGLRNICRSI